MKKVAIVGAGFTGLAAGVELIDQGVLVVIFEANKEPGGLATGFRSKGWKWRLEKFYHHIFANDREVIDLAKKVGAEVIFETPETSVSKGGRLSQLDTPLSLLLNPELSLWGKIRMAVGLGYLKVLNMRQGMSLEKERVTVRLPELVGQEGYKKIWKPLLSAKFGKHVDQVNMTWFWARIVKRTKALGYFEGGFQELAEKCVKYIVEKGGEVRMGERVEKIGRGEKRGWVVNGMEFDQVVLTVPASLVDKIIGREVAWPKVDYLWGQTLILELEKPLMESYWLNVLEKDWPFLVVVEHTNFMDKKNYGKKRVVYVGNYLEEGDKRLMMSEKELINMYFPYLKKINSGFSRKQIRRVWKFQTPFAQPVFPVNYSKKIPPCRTKAKGLYVANMNMVYPWDRGTNYAVEFGRKAAGEILLDRR